MCKQNENETQKNLCPHFGKCGGCVYLDIPYEEELNRKENEALGLLAPYIAGKNFAAIIPAPNPVGYRNKMEFAFGDEGRDGQLALGIRNRRSMYEVSVPDECALVPEDFKKITRRVLDFFRGTDERFYHRRRHTGTLRHLVLRRGEFTNEILINLVTTSALSTPLDGFPEMILSLPIEGKVAGILHTVNDGVADAIKDENVRVLYGRDFFHERINGLTFKVTAFSFFQTNSAGAERLYETVREYAGEGENAYDLYCGTGTIAQLLAKNFKTVTGVELNEGAVLAAKENAGGNGVANAEFFAADVLKFIGSLTENKNQAARESQHRGEEQSVREGSAPIIDTVVVDPPRDGLHPKALEKIPRLNIKRLVYVSCKPSSLARDLEVLTANGFEIEKGVCVDMFPRTAHVETVVSLRRNTVYWSNI